jgi:hypothetical protein
MSKLHAPEELTWPLARLGDAVVALARHSGLVATAAEPARHPPEDELELDRWISAAGDQLGLTVEVVSATYREIDAVLSSLFPAVVRSPTASCCW